MAGDRALVLGGGGVAGIAWQNGVLVGLGDAGVEVADAELLIGTSAGANVAAQFASGLSREELFRRQIDPRVQSRELVPPGNPLADLAPVWAAIGAESGGDPLEERRRVGAVALATRTVPEAARRAVVETRLPAHEWPNRRLLVIAVNAESGQPRVFDRDSGASLVDAVAASSAVPGVWPTVTINGAHYTDGGVRSTTNADYAADCARVLIIAPMPGPPVDQEIADLTARGIRVELITPDEATQTAFGDNPLDTATRIPAAEAGRAQGKSEADRIAAFWG
ncbi:patatin-like phospholipase family protein [Nocardia uniformis]|uniref:Patatin-like phospholipase family protein n=1 Tax=Nocardia uniformis TaxID=53432 RepID=A0A849C6E2_9NOCA|nr:patatin-like phospholipase family protein [Nocardia uniformis]NNH74303.1 patatin-like phospholipase family protein [Nocardia uniformis]